MPFSNPIVGGNVLVRTAIQSRNYTPGVSGWSINRSGSAEFNAATIRGDLIVGNPPTTGLKITSGIPGVLASYYSLLFSAVSSFTILKYAGDGLSYFYEIAGLRASGTAPNLETGAVDSVGNVYPYLSVLITSTIGINFTDTRNPATGAVWAFGSDFGAVRSVNNLMKVYGTDWKFGGGDPADTGSVAITVPLTIDGISAPRGVLYAEAATFSTPTGAVAGVEALVYTSAATVTVPAGRAVLAVVSAQIKSAAVQNPGVQIRQNNLAGVSLVGGPRIPITTINNDLPMLRQGIFVNSTAVAKTFSLAITCTPQVATAVTVEAGAGSGAAMITVTDIGSAAQITGWPSVV